MHLKFSIFLLSLAMMGLSEVAAGHGAEPPAGVSKLRGFGLVRVGVEVRRTLTIRNPHSRVIEGDRMISGDDYHNWAEFFQDGVWRLADPHGRVLGSDAWRYIAFRLMGNGKGGNGTPLGDSQRFRSSGEGLRVRMSR